MSKNAVIEITNLSKEYTDKTGFIVKLLHKVSFTAEENKVTTILAPSGAGKTSLLKIISNLEFPTTGKINTSPETKILFIPSKPSSFPWLNVKDNVEYGLAKKDESFTKELIKQVGLKDYEDHFPNNKSYGFRFRIALARALIRKPNVIVLDEPFNEIDAVTKGEIYLLVRGIHESSGQSFILGTTNITEAIFLSDKIYLLKKNPGEIIDEIEINLPVERNLTLMESSEFLEIRNKIQNSFKTSQTQGLFNFSI